MVYELKYKNENDQSDIAQGKSNNVIFTFIKRIIAIFMAFLAILLFLFALSPDAPKGKIVYIIFSLFLMLVTIYLWNNKKNK